MDVERWLESSFFPACKGVSGCRAWELFTVVLAFTRHSALRQVFVSVPRGKLRVRKESQISGS